MVVTVGAADTVVAKTEVAVISATKRENIFFILNVPCSTRLILLWREVAFRQAKVNLSN